MIRGLRILLALDSAVLFLLGALLMFAPERMEMVFGFIDLPAGVTYIVGLWGCVLATLAFGYWKAAGDPGRSAIWVQMGIARGGLECVFGLVYIARGVITVKQGAAGVVIAAIITIAYIVFYPRKELVTAESVSN